MVVVVVMSVASMVTMMVVLVVTPSGAWCDGSDGDISDDGGDDS